MERIRRIRKNFPGTEDKYVVCDQNGIALYTWYDDARRKSGMKDLRREYEVIEELDRLPDLIGLHGATDAEKIAYANWKWSNSLRLSKKFGYLSGSNDSGQIEKLYDAGAEEIYQDTCAVVDEDKPEFLRLMETLKDQDTLVIVSLDNVARSAKQGAEIVLQLLERGVRVEILSEKVSINAYSRTGTSIMNMLRSIVQNDEKNSVHSQVNKPGTASHLGGRPKVYSQEQLDAAMVMLETHSYPEVSKSTGISKSTLIREKRRRSNT